MRSVLTTALLAILAAASLSPKQTSARTWYVEKDGSGDYVVIQEAIDAAAAGDTIRIGPGRFEDYQTYSYPGGDCDIVGNNTVGELTVIGAGVDMTFVGSEDWGPGMYPTGFANLLTAPDGLFSLSGLTIEGSYYGYISESACDFSITDCVFRGCRNGIRSFVSGLISGCRFEDIEHAGIGAYSPGHDLTVENCEFINGSAYGFYFQASPNMNISDCTFSNCLVVGGGDISSGSITDCEIESSIEGAGLSFYGTGHILVSGCTIRGAYRNLYISGASNLMVEGNAFLASEGESIYIVTCTPTFNNNHIMRGSDYSVLLAGFATTPVDLHIDMTNNYWGSTAANSIAARIHDGNDDRDIKGFVDFEPFLDEPPLPAEKKSLGGFKAMFR